MFFVFFIISAIFSASWKSIKFDGTRNPVNKDFKVGGEEWSFVMEGDVRSGSIILDEKNGRGYFVFINTQMVEKEELWIDEVIQIEAKTGSIVSSGILETKVSSTGDGLVGSLMHSDKYMLYLMDHGFGHFLTFVDLTNNTSLDNGIFYDYDINQITFDKRGNFILPHFVTVDTLVIQSMDNNFKRKWYSSMQFNKTNSLVYDEIEDSIFTVSFSNNLDKSYLIKIDANDGNCQIGKEFETEFVSDISLSNNYLYLVVKEGDKSVFYGYDKKTMEQKFSTTLKEEIGKIEDDLVVSGDGKHVRGLFENREKYFIVSFDSSTGEVEWINDVQNKECYYTGDGDQIIKNRF